jgi:cytochrome c oxidase subunit 2
MIVAGENRDGRQEAQFHPAISLAFATLITLLALPLSGPALGQDAGQQSPRRSQAALPGPSDDLPALPGLTVTVLIPFVLGAGEEMRASTSADRLSVDITGYVYWWEMSYQRADGLASATSANELRLPVGEPVELFLGAADVIHSFWVPSLAGKTDMIPGRVNRMVIQADRPGIYRGQCAEYCGAQHALMAFDVIAMPRSEFDAWLAHLTRPVSEPATPDLAEGRDLFVGFGCGACHAVRGLTDGRLGPDLTEVGARRMIGAGTLPGGVGNIAGWIASVQHLKPGNAMPSYDQLEGRQLRLLAAWLESLG